jgi:hypothetical protein
MNRDKLIKKIDQTLEEYYQNGDDDGFARGYSDGFDDGVIEHKQAMRTRIVMHIETCMNTNKFKEAQFAKEMLEYLMWEYDPEKAEKEQREQEENEDGFGIIF